MQVGRLKPNQPYPVDDIVFRLDKKMIGGKMTYVRILYKGNTSVAMYDNKVRLIDIANEIKARERSERINGKPHLN